MASVTASALTEKGRYLSDLFPIFQPTSKSWLVFTRNARCIAPTRRSRAGAVSSTDAWCSRACGAWATPAASSGIAVARNGICNARAFSDSLAILTSGLRVCALSKGGRCDYNCRCHNDQGPDEFHLQTPTCCECTSLCYGRANGSDHRLTHAACPRTVHGHRSIPRRDHRSHQ
jgi:hypothetical protein